MNTSYKIDPSRLASLLSEFKASRPQAQVPESPAKISDQTSEIDFNTVNKYGQNITLNSKQREFVSLASTGKSCVLIGAAGTGKTTSQFSAVQNLIQSGLAGVLTDFGHKHLVPGAPGIVVCAYTRRAVSNIRQNMPEDMAGNCITIHKLLEYSPVYHDFQNEFGETKTKMLFEPLRNSDNPLSESIHTIVFEETSMLSVDFYKEVMNACHHNVQLIFLGDIQQLPPIFGPAILGFKLLELPTIELTEVYRQALESPIISLAHRILSAKPIPAEEFPSWNKPNQLTIRPWKKKISPESALNTLGQLFAAAYDNKEYDPEEDMILIPFNKACGTDELNKKIANHIAKKNDRVVYQIVAGFNKVHLSVGDKVLYDKEDAIVKSIDKNPTYYGAYYLPASKTLDYWGHDSIHHTHTALDEDNMDFLLQSVAISGQDEERVKKCSHIITLILRDSEIEVKIDTAGAVSSLLLGYSLTVHKAQGSEWRKVFFILHQSHATMIQRELLYTAITRAKEELIVICEPDSLTKGILSQRVKGDTLAEKAEFFKGKLDSGFDLEGY